MPWTNNSSIDALRLQYNAALTAHNAHRRSLIEARTSGATPSAELIDADRAASALLQDVRAKLLSEMTKAIMGNSETEP
jgi:hypothetical protein